MFESAVEIIYFLNSNTGACFILDISEAEKCFTIYVVATSSQDDDS